MLKQFFPFSGEFSPLQSFLPSIKVALNICTLLCAGLVNAQSYLVNGLGQYSEFNETTLIVKLELESPAKDPLEAIAVDTSKKLSIRILKDKTPRAWSRIWIQNLSINNSPDTIKIQTSDLKAMTQAIKGTLVAGDVVEFERLANDLTILSIDDVEIADFTTPDFFEFLLSAFIGSIPPSSRLKAALLSGGDIDNETNVLFDSLGYLNDRPKKLARWAKPVVKAVEKLPKVIEEQVEPTETAGEEQVEPTETAGEEQVEPTETAGEEQVKPTETAGEEQVEPTETAREEQVEPTETAREEQVEPTETAGEEQVEPTETAREEVAGEQAEDVTETAEVSEASEEPIEEIAEEFVEELAEEEAAIIITAESLLVAQNYQRSVLTKVYQNIKYPPSAQRKNREGSLRLAISIGENGQLITTEIVENARYSTFDDSAVSAVKSAAPFDPLPAGTLEIPMILEIPIAFKLQ